MVEFMKTLKLTGQMKVIQLDANGESIMQEPELKRYVGRVKSRDGKLSGEYVDWFTDDDDARATYRVIMEQQGYKVKTVTVENQTAIVEIE